MWGLTIGMLLMLTAFAEAEYTIWASGQVSAEGTVPLAASIRTQARNITDNQPAGEVVFRSITPFTLADQYVEVTFQDNALIWALSIHSDNQGADEQLRRERRAGGLLHTRDRTVVLAVGWQAHNDVQTPPPSSGDPARGGSGWLFMKDINDADWLQAGGYRNVAFGGPGFANIVGPSGPVPNTTGVFRVYVESVGDRRLIGLHTGSLILDLYTE